MSEQASAAVTPGQLIQRRLEARGWSQRTLSVVLDIGESSVTRLLNGKQTVDYTEADDAIDRKGLIGVRCHDHMVVAA